MKNINRITLLNVISTLFLQGVSFFTIPLFTRLLGAEQYGLFSVYNSRVTILVSIIGFGVSSSIGTGIYYFGEKYIEFRNSILIFIVSTGIGLLFVLNIISIYVSGNTDCNNNLTGVLLLTALSQSIINFANTVFIYEKKAGANLILSVLLTLSTVGFSIYLILHFNFDNRYLGRVYGVIIPTLICAIILSIIMLKGAHICIKREYIRYGLSYGIPIIFHSLAHNILSQSDRLMMEHMSIPSSEIGIYSFFYTFSSVLMILMNTLCNSWVPFYYEDINCEKTFEMNNKCQNLLELFSVLIVGFLLLSREVSHWFASEEFWDGMNIIPFIVAGISFTIMYQFPISYELYYKKAKAVAFGTAGAAMLNIVLNVVLIPSNGMYGAAISTAISYGLLFVFHFIIANNIKGKIYHLKFEFFLPVIILVGASCIGFYLLKDFPVLRWALGMGMGICEIYRIKKRGSVF